MSMGMKLICIAPFIVAGILPVWAMLNDKRDLLRRKREEAEDRAGAVQGQDGLTHWPSSAFEPGSIR